MIKPKYITTPIYYVNASPHIGHLYTSLIADSLARYFKLCGTGAFFLTGTDEHGLKVQKAALAGNKSLQEHCDGYAEEFKSLYAAANVKYDRFIRTTDKDHVDIVQAAWRSLHANKLIGLKQHSGYYSTVDESFYTLHQLGKKTLDAQLVPLISHSSNSSTPSPASKHQEHQEDELFALETGSKVEFTSEDNYVFPLGNFQRELCELIEHTSFVAPELRKIDLLSLIRSPDFKKMDLSISRPESRVSWAIKAPGVPDQTIYVWLDALLNYYTAAKTHQQQTGINIWPPDYQVVGKDILKFHSIYWPSFLMGLQLPLPKHIVAHGHWTVNGIKMSKSIGNVVDPFRLIRDYGVDPVRLYLLGHANPGTDQDFSIRKLPDFVNLHLSNGIGNLVQRLTSPKLNPAQTYPSANPSPEFLPSIDYFYSLPSQVDQHFQQVRPDQVLIALTAAISRLDHLTSHHQPWKMIKYEDQTKMNAFMFTTYEGIRVVATLLSPIIPDSSAKILDKLNVPMTARNVASLNQESAPKGVKLMPIKNDPVIFKRLEHRSC